MNPLEGKIVDKIVFSNREVLRNKAEEGGNLLQYCSELHGEYDLDWILEKDSNGNEIARHNVKLLESIYWLSTIK